MVFYNWGKCVVFIVRLKGDLTLKENSYVWQFNPVSMIKFLQI